MIKRKLKICRGWFGWISLQVHSYMEKDFYVSLANVGMVRPGRMVKVVIKPKTEAGGDTGDG